MESIPQEHDKTNKKSTADGAQVDLWLRKTKSNKSAVTIKEDDIEKCEIQLEECGADIDEIFIKLYGQPGRPISVEEQQREISVKETARRERAEKLVENTEDENTAEESEGSVTEMTLIEEDAIEQNSVTFEQAEVDWDDLFEDLESSENIEAQSWLTRCVIV